MEVYLKATRPIRAELNPYLAPFPNPPPLRQSSELDADKSQVFHPFPPLNFLRISWQFAGATSGWGEALWELIVSPTQDPSRTWTQTSHFRLQHSDNIATDFCSQFEIFFRMNET